MKHQRQQVEWIFMTIVVVVFIIAITAVALGDFFTGVEMYRLSRRQLVVGPRGTVAGASIEKTIVAIEQPDGSNRSLTLEFDGSISLVDALNTIRDKHGIPVRLQIDASGTTLVGLDGINNESLSRWRVLVNNTVVNQSLTGQLVGEGDFIRLVYR